MALAHVPAPGRMAFADDGNLAVPALQQPHLLPVAPVLLTLEIFAKPAILMMTGVVSTLLKLAELAIDRKMAWQLAASIVTCCVGFAIFLCLWIIKPVAAYFFWAAMWYFILFIMACIVRGLPGLQATRATSIEGIFTIIGCATAAWYLRMGIASLWAYIEPPAIFIAEPLPIKEEPTFLDSILPMAWTIVMSILPHLLTAVLVTVLTVKYNRNVAEPQPAAAGRTSPIIWDQRPQDLGSMPNGTLPSPSRSSPAASELVSFSVGSPPPLSFPPEF